MKRLYEVTAVVTTYVLAESEADARHAARAIEGEMENAEVTARPMSKGDGVAWGSACLVYGAADEEVSIAQALEKYTEER